MQAVAGVVDFVTADDVPGVNSWKPYGVAEEIFSSGRSHYAGQSLGLVLADTRETALAAARLVSAQVQDLYRGRTDMEWALRNLSEAQPCQKRVRRESRSPMGLPKGPSK